MQAFESEHRRRTPAPARHPRSAVSNAEHPDLTMVDEIIQTFSGFPAHIIQHEMDHLNGILFIDHVLSQNATLFRATGENWEEIQI